MERERRSREYWEQELSEYWDSGLTVQEYSELKELPYESVRRWIRRLKQERPPCRAWRQNGQTVSAGYECPGQRGFISWWLASRLSTGTDGGVNVRNLCTPVTRA